MTRRLAWCGLVGVSVFLSFGARRLGAGGAEPPAPAGLVRMALRDIRIDAETQGPLVVLTTVKGDRALLILIGHAEGMAIAQRVHKLPPPPRPMTHDLLERVLTRLGGTLDRVVITRIVQGTFYAELVVRRDKGLLRIDCRPSDAMALALRAGAPIYCARGVLDEAGADPGPLRKAPPARPPRPKPAKPKNVL